MIGFFLGLAFRRYVKATPENAAKRHTIATLLGVVIGIYCFENEFYHLVFISVVSYLSLHFLPRSYVHLYVAQRVHNSFDDISNSNKISRFSRIIFGFVLTYLSSIHLYTQLFHYGLKQFDVTS